MALTAATALVVDAQRQREPVVWISSRAAGCYPPDLVACGVDLESLPFVHVADAEASLRAADQLVRSGAFGLLVLDLVALPLRREIALLLRSARTRPTRTPCRAC